MMRCGRNRTCRHAEPCNDYLAFTVGCAASWGRDAYIMPTIYGWAVSDRQPDGSHYTVSGDGRVMGHAYRWTNAGKVAESWVVVA